MKTVNAPFCFTLGLTLALAMMVAAFGPSARADEGTQVSQPDYGFRWGEKGCRKRFPVGCGRYWPAPPLKCKYIRWGCPRSALAGGEEP